MLCFGRLWAVSVDTFSKVKYCWKSIAMNVIQNTTMNDNAFKVIERKQTSSTVDFDKNILVQRAMKGMHFVSFSFQTFMGLPIVFFRE